MGVVQRTVLAAALLLAALPAQGLRVVATQPDLADVARRIGGEAVTVETLTEGGEDLHLVRTRPSLLIAVRRADVFLQLGLDAEHAWVPPLLRTARNDDVRPGGPGFVNCSAGIDPLRIPESRTRDEGPDLHPRGNPHYNLDPEGMRVAARNVRDALKRARPAEAAAFDERFAAWEAGLERRLVKWREKLAPFAGSAFVEEHDAWVYFAKRFGLRIVGRLEPKPGLAPTPGHLASVVRAARRHGVSLIVARPGSIDVARKVAGEVGAHAEVLTLSSTTGGRTKGWFRFMDHVVDTFARHVGKR